MPVQGYYRMDGRGGDSAQGWPVRCSAYLHMSGSQLIMRFEQCWQIHHKWHAPVALIAIYCHPVEHLLCNILPLLLGPLLCGSLACSIAHEQTIRE
eukprot:767186-Amphidinium_carterae.1